MNVRNTYPINITRNDQTLAAEVIAILDANDDLERHLVSAVKQVSGTWKAMVRETGEKIYRRLDKLNGRIEGYSEPANVAAPEGKKALQVQLINAELTISKLAKPLRSVVGLDELVEQLDEWTELYLEMASKLDGMIVEETETALIA